MKRNKKIIAVFLILCLSLIVGSPVFAENTTTTTQQTINTTRLSGQTRYETAKAISEYYNQGKVQNVILSTGDGFADALSASVLAHQKDAPILLVDTSVDGSKDAFDYITQHLDLTGTVYIIGGTGIIGKEFETKLNSLGFNNIVRIAGNDRYETSYQLANSLDDSSIDTVVISSGESYPDALSIASFAANKGWPILLTPKDTLPQEMKDYLLKKNPSKVYITGGAGVIFENVKNEISGLLPQANIERLAGQDRFDTNATIAQTFNPNPSTIYIATGYGFADALAGSTLAAKNGDPIMFVDPAIPTLPKSVANYFGKISAGEQSRSLVVFGGNGVVSDEVLKSSTDLISGNAKVDSIYSISDITETVALNEDYSLPATVQAKLYNSEIMDVPVKWNPPNVDTSQTSTYEGVVDGFNKMIKLTLKVNLNVFNQGEGYEQAGYDLNAAQPTSDNWSGQSRFIGPEKPILNWNYPYYTKYIFQIVVGQNNEIYYSPVQGVVSLNSDGTKKWVFATPPSENCAGDIEIGSDGTIYFIFHYYGATTLFALDKNGTIKWQVSVEKDAQMILGKDGIYLSDDSSYQSNDNESKLTVYSFLGLKLREFTGKFGSLAIGSDGTIYSRYYNRLYAYSPNGDLKWSFNDTVSFYGKPQLGPDGTIYIGHSVTGVKDYMLYAINKDGSKKWEVPLKGEFYKKPAITKDGIIYVLTGLLNEPSMLYAIDSNGNIKWSFKSERNGDGVCVDPIVDADNNVYFGVGLQLDYGTVYAFRSDGTKKWEFQTPTSIRDLAMGLNGVLYFTTFHNGIYSLGQ